MTFVLSVQTKGSIWMVADRRLSFDGKPPIDDAVKIAVVEGSDGVGFVGYAGLGATAMGNQPSEWIVKSLRGKAHRSVTGYLSDFVDLIEHELPPHIGQFRNPRDRQHAFIISYVVNRKAFLYIYDLREHDGKAYYKLCRHIMGPAIQDKEIACPIGCIGSGRNVILSDNPLMKNIVRFANAYNNKRIPATTMCSYLADCCWQAHLKTEDGSVGPSSVVVWRNVKGWGEKNSGGGVAIFENNRPASGPYTSIPTVAQGYDLKEIGSIVFNHMMKERQNGGPLPGLDEKLSNISLRPDEKLR